MKFENHIKICILFNKFFDGIILPHFSILDPQVLFYDLIFSQKEKQLMKFSFNKKTSPINIHLFSSKCEIPSKFIEKSMDNTVIRLINDEDEISLHICKVMKIKEKENLCGYIRKIGLNSEQNVTIDKINLKNLNNYKLKNQIKIFLGNQELNTLKKKYIIKLKNYTWLTQKDFYNFSHSSLTNEIQSIDINLISNFFYKFKFYKFKNFKEFLICFGETVSKNMFYKNDYQFSNPNISSDQGDCKIEISKYGDCEDFCVFFMRIFRILSQIFPYFVNIYNPSFKYCLLLKNKFTPIVLICQIMINSNTEFHSTMLLIPRNENENENLKTISFEVTSPKESLDLSIKRDLKKYYSWHLKHFLLVDNIYIYKFKNFQTKNIEKLNLFALKREIFNY